MDGTVIVEEVKELRGTLNNASFWATIFSLIIYAFFLMVGYTGIWPWLNNTFLPDGSHGDAKTGRYILMGSYLLIVTTISLSIMRQAMIDLFNGEANTIDSKSGDPID